MQSKSTAIEVFAVFLKKYTYKLAHIPEKTNFTVLVDIGQYFSIIFRVWHKFNTQIK